MKMDNAQQRTIGVGLVGYGFGGAVFHAPIITRVPGLELRAIVERSGQSSRRDYPAITLCRSVDELLQRRDIDLVVISTPTSTHFSMGKSALESGKHVVIDKPMTVRSAEALELKTISRANGLILSPYHNRRWDRDFRKVARLIRQGRFGKVTAFISNFDLYRPYLTPNAWRERPEPGSGLLYDLGPHLFDQVFFLFGEPVSIGAELSKLRQGAVVDDAFNVTLEYAGFKATLSASLVRKFPRSRFVVNGRSSVSQTGLALRLARSGGRWLVYYLAALSKNAKLPQWLRTIAKAPGDYGRYYENVRDAILGMAALSVTPDDGWRVVRAIELAIESDRLNTALLWDR